MTTRRKFLTALAALVPGVAVAAVLRPKAESDVITAEKLDQAWRETSKPHGRGGFTPEQLKHAGKLALDFYLKQGK